MANESIQWQIPSVPYQQLAQSGRTAFTPGKATSLPDDQNWPTDFAVPQANPTEGFDESGSGTLDMQFERTVLVARNIVANQTVRAGASLTKALITDFDLGKIPEDTSGFDWPNQ